MFTFNLNLDNTEVIHLINTLRGAIMALQDDFNAKIALIADEVRANDDVLASIIQNTNKIFDEVKALVDAQGVIDLAALDALQAAVVAQTANLAQAAAANTAVDGLIPDAPIV